MSITFGGLATGLDTESIVSTLMEIERQPLTRLESDKEYLASRLEAFSTFQTKLTALESAAEAMNSTEDLGSYSVTAGSNTYFSTSVSSTTEASAGDFHVEVVSLAQVQKDVSGGYSDRSTGIFSGGSITINGTTEITIANNSSLNDIKSAINAANDSDETGVSASIITDGSNYRLVLTGTDANTSFSLSTSGITDGTTALGFSNTQAAQSAEIIVDGITITSSSNSFENAIPGITIDLLKENEAGESTSVAVATDYTGIKNKLQAFATAYNSIIDFFSDQQDADWGHDPSFRLVKSKLQGLLVSNVGGNGTYNHLIDLGFESDSKTGKLSIDTDKLTDALSEGYSDVEFLLLGDDSTTGILDQFTSYLDNWTDSYDGLYAAKKSSYDTSVRSLDATIQRMELRLEQREKTLNTQFAAMEELVSSLNTTSTYISNQLSNLSSGSN